MVFSPNNDLSQSLEERDQRLAIFLRKIQTDPVPRQRACLYINAAKPCRDVIVAQAARVEPVFQRHDGAAVLERAAVPYAPERRHLVVARPSPGLQGKIRVRPDAVGQYVVLLKML